jgi:hypothetical protein
MHHLRAARRAVKDTSRKQHHLGMLALLAGMPTQSNREAEDLKESL